MGKCDSRMFDSGSWRLGRAGGDCGEYETTLFDASEECGEFFGVVQHFLLLCFPTFLALGVLFRTLFAFYNLTSNFYSI